MNEAYGRGFDICMISFRGRSGLPLNTPRSYNAMSIEDIREPMKYVFDKYIKGKTRYGQTGEPKAYAIGTSLGAMLLSNHLGEDCDNTVLSGGVCVQAAIKKWAAVDYFQSSLNGTYNRGLGVFLNNYIRANLDIFQPHFLQKFNVDLKKELDKG